MKLSLHVGKLLKSATRKLVRSRAYHGTVAKTTARRRDLPVVQFSQRAVTTCPGRTVWCESHCYATKGFFPTKAALYDEQAVIARDTDALRREVLALKTGTWVRIHPSGDFDSVAYVERWIAAVESRPDVLFWGYTRSWREQAEERVPGIRAALERLRALRNVQLFASTDIDTEEPPANWRAAWIYGDFRSRGLTCPEQTGRHPDCAACGFCILGKYGDVVFVKH